MTVHDTGDFINARTWDLADLTLLELIGLLGVARDSVPFQKQVVGAWLKSPSAVPAPDALKAQAREFSNG